MRSLIRPAIGVRTTSHALGRNTMSPASQPETAQIKVEDAEPLYQELRIENKLTTENGDEVGLKEGAKIEVTIEAKEKDIKPKDEKR